MRHRSAHHYSQFMHRLSQRYIIALLVIALLTGLSVLVLDSTGIKSIR